MRKRRKHVLFVCIGNLCRSPMAEALARKYGSDVLVSWSAGVNPAAGGNHPFVGSVLAEKNVLTGEHTPRRFNDLKLRNYDVIVNMSGQQLKTDEDIRVETWDVEDPIGRSEEFFRETRDKIEMLVMHLILRIRTGKFDSQPVTSRQ